MFVKLYKLITRQPQITAAIEVVAVDTKKVVNVKCINVMACYHIEAATDWHKLDKVQNFHQITIDDNVLKNSYFTSGYTLYITDEDYNKIMEE